MESIALLVLLLLELSRLWKIELICWSMSLSYVICLLCFLVGDGIVSAVCFLLWCDCEWIVWGFGFRERNLGAIVCWPCWFHLSLIISKVDWNLLKSKGCALFFIFLATTHFQYAIWSFPADMDMILWNFHDDDGDEDWPVSTMASPL